MVAYSGNLPKPRIRQSSREYVDPFSPAKMREKKHHQMVMARRRRRGYKGKPKPKPVTGGGEGTQGGSADENP